MAMGTTYRSVMFILVMLMAMFLAGCDKGSSSLNLEKMSSKNKQDCFEPHNPYNDGGGHDAGFNWAEENGGDCNGNSDSFNECLANNRK